MQRIDDGTVDMVLCDLPYGMTDNKWDIRLPLDKLWLQWERVTKNNGAIVLTSMQPFSSLLVMSRPKFFKYALVWSKGQITGFLNAKRQPLREHEDILVFYRQQCVYNPQMTKGRMRNKGRTDILGLRNYRTENLKGTIYKSDTYYPKSILHFPLRRIKDQHPTQKPVALFEYLIRTYTNDGDTVLDNCIGSGTTAIAALNTGRNFIGFEQDADYHAKATARIESIKLT